MVDQSTAQGKDQSNQKIIDYSDKNYKPTINYGSMETSTSSGMKEFIEQSGARYGSEESNVGRDLGEKNESVGGLGVGTKEFSQGCGDLVQKIDAGCGKIRLGEYDFGKKMLVRGEGSIAGYGNLENQALTRLGEKNFSSQENY